MKKVISLLLVFAIVFAFAACGTTNNEDDTTTTTEAPYQSISMRVAGLAGPTGIGLVNLMKSQDNKTAKNDYTFSVVSDPTEIVAGMTNGSYDIAACPVNLASTLYNKLQGNIQVLSVNTKGVLYILENGNTINSLSDLAGKKLYATGQGSTPEYILNYLLENSGITDKVTVEYVASHDELATLAASGKATISMLPEPKVTAALAKNQELRIALNLTEEFEKISGKTLIQGVVIAKKDFVEKNPEAVKMFLKEYETSINAANNDIETTSALCEQYGIIPKAAIAKRAIPNCNIAYIDGADMKASVSANLQIFFDANPKSIGGKLPSDDFYFGA